MWQSFFNPENTLWRGVGKFADILMLSIAWLFLSLPLFTIGAATAGLYDAVVKCVLGGQNGVMSRFWGTFRREFKTATAVTLLWGGLCMLLGILVWTLRAHVVFEGITGAVVLALWFSVLLIPVGALCWMFPLLSRFTFSAGSLISTGIRFALGYFPRTFLLVAAALGAVIVSNWLLVPMLVLPCLVAMFWSKVIEGVFQTYAHSSGEEP